MGFLQVIRSGAVRLVTRASPENPRYSLRDPAAWDAFGMEEGAGAKISPEGALRDSAWWRGISLIANTVAKLPLITYTVDGEGKTRAREHPLFRLLRREPNKEMTAFSFWQSRVGQCASLGNSYAYVLRDNGGRVLELIPLDPSKVWPVRAGGVLRYAVQTGELASGGDVRNVPARDVLHFKGFTGDGLEGYPVWRMAAQELGVGLQARKHVSRVFKNGSSITLILQHPSQMKPEAVKRFLANWNQAYAGADNAFKTAILEEGMKAQPINLMSFKDAQMTELRRLHNQEVANFLGLPPHKLGETSRSAYASLEMETQALLDDCIDPWLVMIEAEVWSKLLTTAEQDAESVAVEFLRAALVRADTTARNAAYKSALAGVPWMTINEVRSAENRNPLPGGDRLVIPISVQDPDAEGGDHDPSPRGAAAEPAPEDDPDDAPADGATEEEPVQGEDRMAAARAHARRMLEEAHARMARRLAEQLRRNGRTPARLGAWIAELGEQAPVVRAALTPAAEMLAIVEGAEPAAGAAVAVEVLLQRVRDAVGRVRAADQREFAAAVEAAAATLEAVP